MDEKGGRRLAGASSISTWLRLLFSRKPWYDAYEDPALILLKELFLDTVIVEAYKRTATEKRKTVQYKDVAGAIAEIDAMEFLTGIVAEFLPA